MSEAFLNAEREYTQFSNNLISKFHTAHLATQFEVNEAQEEFKLVKQNLQYMSLELTSTDPKMKVFQAACQTKVQLYRKEFQQLQTQYNQYINELSGNRAINLQDAQQEKMMNLKIQLSEQNSYLKDIKKDAYQADGLATNIQFELKKQTNQIERMTNQQKETQNEIGQSETLIAKIKRQGCIMKIIWYFMIFLIVLAIIYILWYNYRHH